MRIKERGWDSRAFKRFALMAEALSVDVAGDEERRTVDDPRFDRGVVDDEGGSDVGILDLLGRGPGA